MRNKFHLAFLYLSGLFFLSIVSNTIIRSDTYLVSPETIKAYLILPVLTLILVICSIFNKKYRLYFSALVAILILGIFLSEIILRIVESYHNDVKVNQHNNPNISKNIYDYRTIKEVVSDLRKNGKLSYPVIGVNQFLGTPSERWVAPLSVDSREIVPLTQVANANLVYCNEGGSWFIYKSDRFGFNNPDILWNKNRIDLAIIGDSFASGACIAKPEPGLLEQIRSDIPSSLSISSPSSGPLLQLALMKEYLVPMRPKNVVWFFSDLNGLSFDYERQFHWLRNYLDPININFLSEHHHQINSFVMKSVDANLNRSEKANPSFISLTKDLITLRKLRESRGLTSCPNKNQQFYLLEETFKQAKLEIEKWGGYLTVVYMPNGIEPACDLMRINDRQKNWYYHNILQIFERQDISVLNLKQAYAELGSPTNFYFFPGSHFTEHGYAWVSSQIIRHLKVSGVE